MERKHNCKRMVAWLLTIAMVFGNSSFAALAEETAPAEAAAVQAEAIQSENTVPAGDAAAVETSEFAPAEDAAIAEAPEDAAAENTAAAEKEDALIEEEAAAPEEGSEADVPVEEAAPEAEGILLEGMEVVPEGVAPMAEEGEDEEEPVLYPLLLKWTDYGYGGNDENLNPERFYWGTWVYVGKEITLDVEGVEELGDLEGGTLETKTVINKEGGPFSAEKYFSAALSIDQQHVTVKGLQKTGSMDTAVEIWVTYKDHPEKDRCLGGSSIKVREPVEDYSYQYDWYNNNLLVDQRIDVGPTVHFYLENSDKPYGYEGEAQITDVVVDKQYRYDEDLKTEVETEDGIVRAYQEGDSWELEAVGYGRAEYHIEFKLPEDETIHSSETGTIYVSGDAWSLGFEYPNYEDDSMLPGGTMTIDTTLYHDWYHNEDDYGNEEIKEHELRILTEDTGDLQVTTKGSTITVKAGDEGGYYIIEVAALLNGEEKACHDFSVNVVEDGYHLIRVDNMDEINNLAPGASVTIDPVLVSISPEGNDDVQENVKYRMEFDSDILSVTDANDNDLLADSEDGEAVMGSAPLTITKKTNDYTDARLTAMLLNENGDYEEQCGINLHFWDQDYSIRYEFDFDGIDENGCNGGVPLFNNEDKEITADTSYLDEMGVEYKIVWKVGRVERQEDEQGGERWLILNPLSEEDGYYTVKDNTITLHGEKLAQKYPPFEGEDSFFDVRAQVFVNDISVWEDDGPGFEMREAQEWFIQPLQGMSENEAFPNEPIWFGAKTFYYIQNKMYPDGVELPATITDVRIIRNMLWTEDGNVETENPLFTVTGSEKEGWTLTAGEAFGRAYLEVNFEVEPDPEKPEMKGFSGTYGSANDEDDECFSVCVTGEKHYIELVDTEDDIWVSSGGEKTIFTKAWREFLDEDGELQTEEIKDYELRFAEYDTNMINDVKDNNDGSFTIMVKEDRINWETNMCIQCWVQMEGDKEPWQWCGDLWSHVRVNCPDGEHVPNEDGVEETKKPTCTETGMRKFTCEKCGKFVEEEIAATGHSWGAWSAPTEATIFAASTRSRTCTVCKKQETQTLGAKLTPVLKLTANSLKMKTKQTTKKFLVTEIANGDSVASVTSSNAKVLKVKAFNSGTGTFTLAAQKKKGKANLTITLASGLSRTIKVTVQSAKVKTTKVALDKASKKITLSKGKKYTLKPTVTPVTSQDKISYTSSNKAVAAVSSKGVITAKKKGKAKITIKSGKKKVVCTVTVK